VAPTPTPRDSGLGTIAFSIAVPPPATAARTRVPRYVSSSSYQAAVIVTPQGGTALAPQILVCQIPAGGGGKVCAGSLSAPPGVDSVGLTLEDQPLPGNARGKALSQGTTVAIVNAGQTTTIHATLDGIVHNIDVKFAAPEIRYAPTLPYSAATQGTQTVGGYASVNAYDADGNVITYNGGYVDSSGNPVSIQLTPSTLCGGSAACTIALGALTVSGPGAVIPVTAKLADSVSAFRETFTVTPSVLFGNPGGTLTAGSVTFVRPSSCAAYLPAPASPSASWTIATVPVVGALSFDISGDPTFFYALDTRLGHGYVLTSDRFGAVGFAYVGPGSAGFTPSPPSRFYGTLNVHSRSSDSILLDPGILPTRAPLLIWFQLGIFDGVSGLCSDSAVTPVIVPSFYPPLTTIF
jgi:hypothetical protein